MHYLLVIIITIIVIIIIIFIITSIIAFSSVYEMTRHVVALLAYWK